MAEADWERRLELLWASIDDRDEDEFVAAMEDLVAELPPGDAVGLFEQASAFDSTGLKLDAGSDELDDAVRAFLALALTGVGRDREAVSHALTALAPHLPRYNRSLAAYARELA